MTSSLPRGMLPGSHLLAGATISPSELTNTQQKPVQFMKDDHDYVYKLAHYEDARASVHGSLQNKPR